MGYMRHIAIVVTSSLGIQDAHDEAVRLFGAGMVSTVVEAEINGYQSFLIGPDGSKLGWEISETHGQLRDTFIDWLQNNFRMKGSWAEVQYGDDDMVNRLLRSDLDVPEEW